MKTILKALTITVLMALVAKSPAIAQSWPGEYAIRTSEKKTYITARPGSRSDDSIVTSASTPGVNERFRFERHLLSGRSQIKTPYNYYFSASRGGGWGPGLSPSATLTLSPGATDYEQFDLVHIGSLDYALRTFRGYFLTAIDGGGRATGAFYSNSNIVGGSRETYRINKCGDIGDVQRYAVVPKGGSRQVTTINGRKTFSWYWFKREARTGWYELWNGREPGIEFVGTFAVTERADCSYTMQTTDAKIRGNFLGVARLGLNPVGVVSTNIPTLQVGASQGFNVYFELVPVF